MIQVGRFEQMSDNARKAALLIFFMKNEVSFVNSVAKRVKDQTEGLRVLESERLLM